jgi:hypothetical protein
MLTDIVRTSMYLRSIRKLKATADELAAVEAEILVHPEIGQVVPGLRGVRKIRFAMGGKGKRGGGRAIYYVVWLRGTAYMLIAYSKSEKSDLTGDDRRAIRGVLENLPG